ncbi:hypothetical protein HYALB_00001509 [Hymenoscyphus albidus]|uniref:Uncharacterized protein n=1 Tax=Hymenoscyphus albidus TaxID=595503 RepID=A0A9N9Q0W6_9HELO|nr:hypothetical protein HYALB_00001509 [Hymenoscyphus albidus]
MHFRYLLVAASVSIATSAGVAAGQGYTGPTTVEPRFLDARANKNNVPLYGCDDCKFVDAVTEVDRIAKCRSAGKKMPPKVITPSPLVIDNTKLIVL